MADDDETAGEHKPIAPANAGPKPVTTQRPQAGSTEWTASDNRGPLETAEEEAEDLAKTTAAEAETGERVGPISSSHPGFGPKPDMDASIASPVPPPLASLEAGNGATLGASDTTSDPAAAPRERSLWPVAAGIVVGALIGAGSAYLFQAHEAGSGQPDPQVASLSARVDALEKRPDPQAEISKVQSALAALSSKVAGLEGGTGVTASKSSPSHKNVDDAQPAAPANTAPAAVDLAPLNEKIAGLQADLDALKGRGADTKALQEKVAALDGTLAGIKTATAEAQASVSTVEGEQKALAGRVTMPALAVVADSLVQQIDLGQPYAAQLNALVALNADPAKIAVLRQNADKGVPSAKTLAAKFDPLVEPIEATAQKPPANAGFMDRLKSGALSLVSIRRADDTSGHDLPSQVARIKAALAHDDVPGAVAAFDALPPDARSKGTAWGLLAKDAAEAMTAARVAARRHHRDGGQEVLIRRRPARRREPS